MEVANISQGTSSRQKPSRKLLIPRGAGTLACRVETLLDTFSRPRFLPPETFPPGIVGALQKPTPNGLILLERLGGEDRRSNRLPGGRGSERRRDRKVSDARDCPKGRLPLVRGASTIVWTPSVSDLGGVEKSLDAARRSACATIRAAKLFLR